MYNVNTHKSTLLIDFWKLLKLEVIFPVGVGTGVNMKIDGFSLPFGYAVFRPCVRERVQLSGGWRGELGNPTLFSCNLSPWDYCSNKTIHRMSSRDRVTLKWVCIDTFNAAQLGSIAELGGRGRTIFVRRTFVKVIHSRWNYSETLI